MATQDESVVVTEKVRRTRRSGQREELGDVRRKEHEQQSSLESKDLVNLRKYSNSPENTEEATKNKKSEDRREKQTGK